MNVCMGTCIVHVYRPFCVCMDVYTSVQKTLNHSAEYLIVCTHMYVSISIDVYVCSNALCTCMMQLCLYDVYMFRDS